MKRSTVRGSIEVLPSGAARVRVRGVRALDGRPFSLSRVVGRVEAEHVRAELAAQVARVERGEERPRRGRPRGAPRREVTCALETRDVERLDALAARDRHSRRELLRRAVLALLASEGA